MPKKRRMMILTEGKLGIFSSKTATSLIRYCPDEVACVLDSVASKTGKGLESFIGVGAGIPLVASVKEGLRHKPTELLIGIAPVGGLLPKPWRKVVIDALRAKLDVVSGLHFVIADDPEFAALAKKNRVKISDVRIPPADIGVAEDKLRSLKQRRIALVGSDCNIGKMVTAIELDRALRREGHDSEFVATGQTGIMIAGSGIAVDHVLSDYVNGAAERLCWERRKRGVLVMEGQGSVFHPAYSGVTVGLLHGCMPHAIIVQHAPARKTINHYPQFKLPPLKEVVKLTEDLVKPVFPAPVVAIGLNTFGMTAAEASRVTKQIERETGLPACDPIRDGSEKLVRAVAPFIRVKK